MTDITGSRVRRGREALAQILDRETSPEGVRELVSLPPATRLKVFEEAEGTASGQARLRLAEAAALTGVSEQAERLTRSARAANRIRGLRLLTLTGGGRKDLVRLLYDRDPEVRVQAATWAADHPEPAVVWGLLEMLNHDDERCRSAARSSLTRLGSVTVEPVGRALMRTRRPFSDHGLVGLLEVAGSVGDPRLTETVIGFCDNGSPQVRRAAVRALGAIGGSLAAPMVERLLDDEDPEVRSAAALAIGRLGRWRSSARLGELLTDHDDSVRAAAEEALRHLGAPGVLMLRRHNATTTLHSVN